MITEHALHREKRALTQRVHRCLLWLTALLVLAALALMLRLFYLQILRHDLYSTQSRNNLVTIIPTAPNRGRILDRYRQVLAENHPVYNLAVMNGSPKTLQESLKKINAIIPLTQQEKSNCLKLAKRYRLYQPVPLKTHLTEQQVATFYVNRYRLPNTILEHQMQRYYPLGPTVSHIVGYVGRISNQERSKINTLEYQAQPLIGKTGIEKQYESELHGSSGAENIEINATGQLQKVLSRQSAIAGKDIRISIDSRLQQAAEKAMGKDFGAIVAMDPNNGEILAMVSEPTFDNNLFIGGISKQHYHELLTAAGHPLFDRSIRGQFAPGSTAKPFIALGGLHEKIINDDYVFDDHGWFKVDGTKHIYHDWRLRGHGWVDMRKAIKVSCDVFFYHLAEDLGATRLIQALKPFGFGVATGLDFPQERHGLLPTPNWKKAQRGSSWFTGDTIEMGIGQGYFLVTPLQLALATSLLATHGHAIQPHLLLQEKNTVTTNDPTLQSYHETEWQQVIQGMQDVIDGHHGTGHYFGPHKGFTVAGKTGTAQVYGHHRDEVGSRHNLPKKLRNNHLFIAFAPIKHPRIAVAVIVEHSAFADKKAGDVLRAFFAEQRSHVSTPTT